MGSRRPSAYAIRVAGTTGVLRELAIDVDRPFDGGRLTLSGDMP